MVKRIQSDEKLNELRETYLNGLNKNQEIAVITALEESGKVNRSLSYELYLSSKHWKEIRMEVLKRDNFRCVKCKSTHNLHVDHIRYPGYGDEELSDLQTLCYKCHSKKTKKKDLEANSKYTNQTIIFDGPLFTLLRRDEQ